MTRVFLADSQTEERLAFRLLLQDMNLVLVGEASDWITTQAQVPGSHPEMLLIDLDMLPSAPTAALEKLRASCPAALVIVLITPLDARRQAAISIGADAFISKVETPDRIMQRLRAIVTGISIS